MERQAQMRTLSKIRLLICSDAGSQGVNLHYNCNRMFNYDLPWSLITLEQRNGRIDRYGQTRTPYIHYLIAHSQNKDVRDDLNILKKLWEKENEVYNSLGDAGSVMEVYDVNTEQVIVSQAILKKDEDFLQEDHIDQVVKKKKKKSLDAIIGERAATKAVEEEHPIETEVSLFNSDAEFYAELFQHLKTAGKIRKDDVNIQNDGQYLEILNTADLEYALRGVPVEAKPVKNDYFRLTTDKDLVQKYISKTREKTEKNEQNKWSKFQMLYEMHPVIRYYFSMLDSCIEKDVALAAKVDSLPKDTAWYVFHGSIANGLGQQVAATYLQQQLYYHQMSDEELQQLESLLSPAVDQSVITYMNRKQIEMEGQMQVRKDQHLEQLRKWQADAFGQLDLFHDDTAITYISKNKKERIVKEIETIHNESSQYVQNMNTLKGDAFIRPLAVFFNF